MSRVRLAFSIFVLATVAVAGPALAQPGGRLFVRAHGGGVESLSSLHSNEVYAARTGPAIGGGLGYRVTEIFSVRAEVTRSVAPIDFQGADFGADLTRTYASLVAEFALPRERVRPYLLTGLGATVLRQPHPENDTPTFQHWVGGAGVEFGLGTGGLALLAESRLHVYQARGLVGSPVSDPRVMADASLAAGLLWRFRS